MSNIVYLPVGQTLLRWTGRVGGRLLKDAVNELLQKYMKWRV